MKKIFTILFLFSVTLCKAQYVTINDTALVNWFNQSGYGGCLVGNLLDTTSSDLQQQFDLDISNPNIQDLYGIQFFSGVPILYIHGLTIDSIFYVPDMFAESEIDATNNPNLKYIQIPYNSGLEYLNIDSCAFTQVPQLPVNLLELYCSYNQFSGILDLPNGLNGIYCTNNQITELRTNSVLQYLDVSNNPNLSCIYFPYTALFNFYFNNTNIACLPPIDTVVDNSIPDYQLYPVCQFLNPNNCPVPTGINGTVYHDANSNCAIDAGEQTLPEVPVRLYQGGNLIAQSATNNAGQYVFDALTNNTYTVEIDTSGFPFAVNCPASGIYTVVLTGIDSVSNENDFGINCLPVTDGDVFSAVIDSGLFIAGRKCLVSVRAGDIFSAYNSSCTGNLSGTLTVTYAGDAQYAGVAAGSIIPTVSGNTLTWNISDFNTVDIFHDFHIRFLTDTSASIQSQICIVAQIDIDQQDNNPSNDVVNSCLNIFSSFDPNFKEVTPNILPSTPSPLTYTIHFQNTGTASAENIYLLDTLDSDLNLNSFKFLGSSHYCVTQLLQGGIIRFNFPAINLLDSNTNEPASHGWAQYSIEQKEGLNLSTATIENTASIYFDFNSPVVTNTTHTSFATGMQELPIENNLLLYPNPVTDKLTLEFPNGNPINQIEITDVLGRKVFAEQTNQKSVTCNLKLLISGIYFIKVQSRNGEMQVKKIVKQ